MILYSINDDVPRNRFELLMETGFEWVRRKHYNTVIYFKIISTDDTKEMEKKIRLIANEIIWGKDDGLEILNLNMKHKKNSLWFTNEERIIIKGYVKLEEDIILWLEMMFALKQAEVNYFKNVNK